MYTLTQGLVYGVPLLIGIANFVSKVALGRMSLFERRHTISEQKYSKTINVAAISFLNVGVMVLLVNLKMEEKIDHLPFFQGRYSEFSVEWYRLVGSSLCV
jgi:hypothetical protein